MKASQFFAFKITLAVIGLASFFIMPSLILAATEQGTLLFSPATVRNGGNFSITLTGGPVSTQTRIWVNNGSGFQDFGTWLATDAAGNINAQRTLNCNAYQTLQPGRILPIGNRQLTQTVYLEYVGTGKVSNAATQTKDCTTSGATSPNPNPVGNVNFPSGATSYSVTTSKGSVAAFFKFAPPIAGAIFNQQNIGTYLGNRFKSIVWIPNSYPGGAGPLGRWDISDPWNPRNGGVVGLANGGSALAVGTQPGSHKGPFYTGSYPHSPALAYGGGSLGELANGQGRFVFDFGEDCHEIDCRPITPVVSLAVGQGMSIGQLLPEHIFEGVSVGGDQTKQEGRTAIDATASGKFFIFVGGGTKSGGSSPRALEVFDATNLTGAVSFNSPYLRPISSESWQNITELQVVEVPGVRNHFLIARSGTLDITAKPVFYIGEIDANTGSFIRQNSFTLDMQGISYKAPYSPGSLVFPGSGLQFAKVNGKAYVFMNEQLVRNSYDATVPGILKVAAFEFNPQNLSFVRKGDLTLNSSPRLLGENAGSLRFQIARAEVGDVYPMLAAWGIYKEPVIYKSITINNNPTNLSTPRLYSINLYSLKEIIDSTTSLSVTPTAADVVIPEEEVVRPLTVGQVETQHLTYDNSSITGGSSYGLLLKKEGAKNNLYLYRKAFLFDGRAYGGSGGIYDTINVGVNAAGDQDHAYAPFTGPTTLRVDKIDVSGFTGGAFTGSGSGGGTAPSTIGGACSGAYSALCDQLDQLRKLVCKLNPSADFCGAAAN